MTGNGNYANLLKLTEKKKFVKLLQVNLFSRLVDKWSGSIEVGITTHNPSTLEFPATMTNEASGTMMMSGMNMYNGYLGGKEAWRPTHFS